MEKISISYLVDNSHAPDGWELTGLQWVKQYDYHKGVFGEHFNPKDESLKYESGANRTIRLCVGGKVVAEQQDKRNYLGTVESGIISIREMSKEAKEVVANVVGLMNLLAQNEMDKNQREAEEKERQRIEDLSRLVIDNAPDFDTA